MNCTICSTASHYCIPIYDKYGNDKEKIALLFAKFGVQLKCDNGNAKEVLCPSCYVTITGFQQILQKLSKTHEKSYKNSNWKILKNSYNYKRLRFLAGGVEFYKSTPMDIEVDECEGADKQIIQLMALSKNKRSQKFDTIFHNCDIEIDSPAQMRSTNLRADFLECSNRTKLQRYSNEGNDLELPVKLKISEINGGNRKSKTQKKHFRCELCGISFIEDICYQNHNLLKHTNCAHEGFIEVKPFHCMKPMKY